LFFNKNLSNNTNNTNNAIVSERIDRLNNLCKLTKIIQKKCAATLGKVTKEFKGGKYGHF